MSPRIFYISMIVLILIGMSLMARSGPYRVGTTTANFLEIGVGSAANAMGEASVAAVRDLSSVYWNVAGLAFLEKHEVQFSYQPWIADISVGFVGVGIVLPIVGNLALSIKTMDYGQIGVTTLEMQEGTGETYSSLEYVAAFSYSRKLAQWFAFGASGKYVASNIWHMNASALALDLGVMVNTHFFAGKKNRENGLTFGMSISNYGTRMQYDGMNLLRSIDILPDQTGNYKDVEGQFRLQYWELPLVLRVGIAIYPLVSNSQKLTIALDALHPNNNCESVNVGGQYQYNLPGTGRLFLRGGFHSLFMDETGYGMTLGGGIHFTLLGNRILMADYAYKDIGVLGYTSSFTVGFSF